MKKNIKLNIVLCVLLVPGMAMAVNQTWVNWGGNQDWSQTNNWNGFTVPTAADEAHFNVPSIDGAIVNSNNAVTGRIVMSNGSSLTIAAGGNLNNSGEHMSGVAGAVDSTTVFGTYSVATAFGIGLAGGSSTLMVNSGGIVTSTGDWMISGWQAGSTGAVTVNGGTIHAGNLHVGWAGDGSLTLNNGASVTSGVMNVAVDPTAIGLIEINDGVLTVAGLNAGATTGSATITLNGGQLINTGGFVRNSNAIFNINGGEFIFEDATLEGVNSAIDAGIGTWNFAEFRSVVDNGDGSITVSSTSTLPAPIIVSSSVSNSVMAIVVKTPPSTESYYYPLASGVISSSRTFQL